MTTGRKTFRTEVIPLSKPLSCWLVSDDDPTPYGPHEVHAMMILSEGVAGPVQVRGETVRSAYFDVPGVLDRHADQMMPDGGAEPETAYFIPTAQLDDGCCWWPERYVSFSEANCVNIHKNLHRGHKVPQ